MYFTFNISAHTHIYTLSLHDALPIFADNKPYLEYDWDTGESGEAFDCENGPTNDSAFNNGLDVLPPTERSAEHTSELQSRGHLVCRLLLEKKNKRQTV